MPVIQFLMAIVLAVQCIRATEEQEGVKRHGIERAERVWREFKLAPSDPHFDRLTEQMDALCTRNNQDERECRRSLQDVEVGEWSAIQRTEKLEREIAKRAERMRLVERLTGGEEERCSICMELCHDPESVCTTLCDHLFHHECMKRLRDSVDFQREPKCPNCRTSLREAADVAADQIGQQGPVMVRIVFIPSGNVDFF